MNKHIRFNQLSSAITLTAVTALGAAACSGSNSAPESIISVTHSAKPEITPSTAPNNISPQSAETSILDRMKLDSLAAANIILKGLARPDVKASAFDAPKNPLIFGNTYVARGTNKPDTFFSYNRHNDELYLRSVSETSVNNAGAPTLSVGLTFKLTNTNPLISKEDQTLTESTLQSALSNPANLSLVSGGATYSSDEGFAVVKTADRLKVLTGYSAENGSSLSQDIDLTNPSSKTESDLSTIERSLNSALQQTVAQLSEQFTL